VEGGEGKERGKGTGKKRVRGEKVEWDGK